MEEKNNDIKTQTIDKQAVIRARDYRKNGYQKRDSASAFLFGGFLSPILALLVISFLFAMISSISGIEYKELLSKPPFNIIVIICAELGFLGYFLYLHFISKKKKNIKSCIGFSFKKVDVYVIAIIVILAVVMSLLSSQFIDLVNYGLKSLGYSKSTSLPMELNSVGNLILGLISMALIPAICEELLFRGVVLGGMLNFAKTNKARIIAVILSAVIFALIHQSALQIVYPFAMGLVFGFIYLYTGNLLYNIILHFVSNGFVVCVNYYYAVNNITQGEISYSAGYILSSIVQFIFCLALAFGAIWIIRLIMKNKSPFMVNESDVLQLEGKEFTEKITDSNEQETENVEITIQDESKPNINQIELERDESVAKILYIVGLGLGVCLLIADIIGNIV